MSYHSEISTTPVSLKTKETSGNDLSQQKEEKINEDTAFVAQRKYRKAINNYQPPTTHTQYYCRNRTFTCFVPRRYNNSKNEKGLPFYIIQKNYVLRKCSARYVGKTLI